MKNKFRNIRIFVDFDGTITKKDVGNKLFEKYIVIKDLNEKLKSGKVSIYKYWQILFKELPDFVNEDAIKNDANDFEIDNYFKAFAKFCDENNIEVIIVSDGFDTYIKQILDNNNIDLKYYSNKISYEEGIKPVFPGATEGCDCFSANCKRNLILNKAHDEDLKIYVGDGYSDFCAATHCDVIFAKKDLAAYCNKNSLPHHNFKTFFDVKRKLENLIQSGKLKKRNRATVLSKKAFEYE